MNYGKNIIATVLICGVVSTVAFAAAKKAVWTLNGEVLQTQIAKKMGLGYLCLKTLK